MSRPEDRRRARESAGPDLSKFYVAFAIVAVVGLGVVGYQVLMGTVGRAASVPVDIEGLDDPARLSELARGVTIGSDDAEVTIVEFGDFQCPSCAMFAAGVKPQIDRELIETGRAKFVFYDRPLVSIHPNAFISARAARCAEDQNQFWSYHDELFRRQSEWAGEASPEGVFEDIAEGLGLDGGSFRGCLRSDAHAELVSANLRMAEQLGINQTPTVLVRVPGERARQLQSLDFGSIQAVVEELTGSESR